MPTPTARLVEPVNTITVVSATLDTSAWMTDSFSAVTVTSPSASTVELWTRAVASAGCWLPNAFAIRGSPSSVSIALKRKFCDFQPIELNASVTPAPSPWLSIELSACASITDTFSACTATSPVAVTGVSSISASALERITFVAITNPSASAVPPLFRELPPDTAPLTSAVERMNAASCASMWTLAAVTEASRTAACVSLRTSL